MAASLGSLRRLKRFIFTVMMGACFYGQAAQVVNPSHTNPNVPRGPLVLTPIANAGVMVSSGESKVLIDALFDKPNEEYRAPSPEALDRIMKGVPPFDGVGLLLVTHNHPDHFDARLSVRYLETFPGAIMIAPADAAAAMRLAAADWTKIEPRVYALDLKDGEKTRRDLKGVSVAAFRTLHGRGGKSPMNIMYLLDLNGWSIFHEGDSPGDIDEYRRFGLGSSPVDLALVHYWFPLEPNCAKFLLEVIKPNHIALTHLPIKYESDWPARIDRVRECFKDIFLMPPGTPAKVFQK